MHELKTSNKAVGLKECIKQVSRENAKCAYIAKNAQPHITEPFAAMCEAHRVPVKYADSMEALGKACDIDVGAAVALIKISD